MKLNWCCVEVIWFSYEKVVKCMGTACLKLMFVQYIFVVISKLSKPMRNMQISTYEHIFGGSIEHRTKGRKLLWLQRLITPWYYISLAMTLLFVKYLSIVACPLRISTYQRQASIFLVSNNKWCTALYFS